MRRNLLVLNAGLLVLVCLLGWYLRKGWLAEQNRERSVRMATVRRLPVVPPQPLSKIKPLDGPAYGDVATKNLFSPDRSPVPIIDPPAPPPPPPPMPALPASHGVMLWDGVPPTVVLSIGKGPQKGYHPGDKIGEFTLVSVNNTEIVFDWDGKKVSKRLDEIMEKDLLAASAPPPAPAQTAPAATNLSTPASGSNLQGSGPLGQENGGVRMCTAGDNSPAGSVVDGFKKVVTQTPFNTICRWEPVQ